MIKVIQSSPVWLPQTHTWMYNQAKYLLENIESHVVCERTENLDQFFVPSIHSLTDVPVWRYFWDKGLKKLRLRRYLGFLVQVAKEIKADVLHSHFGTVGWANIVAAKRAGLKHVVTFYGVDVNRMPTQDSRWLGRYMVLFESADLFLCEGPHMAECIRKLGCPREKIKVHHLGVDVDKILYLPRKWRKGDMLRVLIAASFREKKGIPYALEALGQLQKDVNLEITIIGDANATLRGQQEKQKILRIIQKYNSKLKVRMLGYQPYSILFQEAYKHHIFLSPSVTAKDGDTEGGAPVSIIEMAATGMPIVSTSHCDIPEVIKNSETGLLAEERNVKQLIHHLRWLIEHPKKWSEMLIAGRNRIEKEFDVRVQAAGLGEFYIGLVSR